MRWQTLLIASAMVASVGCGRRDAGASDREPSERIRRLLEDKTKQVRGRSLNAMSPETVGSLVPHLRVGMSYEELGRILAAKNRADPKTGEHIGTVVFGRGVVWLVDEKNRPLRDERGELRVDPSRWTCTLSLRDANLEVVLDQRDRILSWSHKPLPKE
jgi:hypothetical protein